MKNEYGHERQFKVYKIVSNGQVGAFETFYGLVYIQRFNNLEDAKKWIIEEGERHLDYTVLETIRNK